MAKQGDSLGPGICRGYVQDVVSSNHPTGVFRCMGTTICRAHCLIGPLCLCMDEPELVGKRELPVYDAGHPCPPEDGLEIEP